MLTAQKIYEQLDKRVVGQEHAKRTLAAAGFLHVIKTLYWKQTYEEAPPLKSSNVLIMGPSGSGKTYLVQNLAEYLNMPYLEINTRALSNEGYKGLSISDQFESFYNSFDKEEKARALHGIIFLDEFDKICTGSGDNRWELSLQHSLLKILEGGKIDFSSEMRLRKQSISAKNMLFILGGNFEALRILPRTIGFKEPEKNLLDVHEQLVNVGMIKEVAGRISLVTQVEALSKADLKRALKAENNIYQQYKLLYQEMFCKEFNLSSYRIDKIVELCERKKIGARGLQAALDEYIVEKIFEEEIDLEDYTE